MRKKRVPVLVLLVPFVLLACGGEAPAPASAADGSHPAPASAAATAAPTPAARSSFKNIAQFSEIWNELYKKNEAAVNGYEGMPIMQLVTPQLTFVTSVQYDILNPTNAEGRHEGKLMLAGYPAFVERAGSRINFGYDFTRDKDGYGPAAKTGDRIRQRGFLDLAQAHYQAEESTERAGQTIQRSLTEFKRLPDGSMICLNFSGGAFNIKGDADNHDEAIFLHNGVGRYDFVIAKAANGPGFTPISFTDQGNLTKEKALELFGDRGYTIEKSGGIQDGKLVLDR